MPRVVTFHYTLRDSANRVLDTSAGGEPITFLEGSGQIIEGLGLSIATPDEAREILELKGGDKVAF